MIRNLFLILLPIVVLVDIALLATWVTMMYLDGIGIPRRVTIRGVVIALAVVALHAALIAVYLTRPIPFQVQ
jgi:hypothetical protein